MEWNHGVEWSGVDLSGVRVGVEWIGVEWNGIDGMQWSGVDLSGAFRKCPRTKMIIFPANPTISIFRKCLKHFLFARRIRKWILKVG